jgi:pyruvate ferredoxin oxidoreductase delta subunit
MERCKACGQCVEVCPDAAVQLRDEIYVIDYEYCKGCGLCAFECPAEAIEMKPEEK